MENPEQVEWQDAFEVESSAIPPDGEEASLPMTHGSSVTGLSPRARVRRVILAGSALLLLGLLLGSLPTVRQQVAGLFSGSLYGSAQPSAPVPARSGQGAPSLLPPGWKLAGPAYAQEIVFAPSEPATAYICGGPALSVPNQPVPISLGVSRDHGGTWQTFRTPATAVACTLTINPTNARDVLLAADPCPACDPLPPLGLYRTQDGGATWSAWPLPPNGPKGAGDLLDYYWAWAGSTLFLAPLVADVSGYTLLAASIAGRPFTWVDQHGLFAVASVDASINRLFGDGTTLYVVLSSLTQCQPTCETVIQTSDNGVSWAVFAPSFQGQTLAPLAMSADGRIMFSQVVHDTDHPIRTYVHSRDAGATWSELPAVPGGQLEEGIVETPDGTIYLESWNPGLPPSEPPALPGIYTLEPGANAWVYLAPYPGARASLTVAWDGAGHPVALWAKANEQTAPGELRPGLEYHLP